MGAFVCGRLQNDTLRQSGLGAGMVRVGFVQTNLDPRTAHARFRQ